MKRILAVLCLAIYIAVSCLLPVSANTTDLTMAINAETMFVNGIPKQSTPPILVLGKTYVNLYAVAPLLGMNVSWVEAERGFFRVTGNGISVDFNLIYRWDDLSCLPHQYFIKDDTVYVSLRELTELAEETITYIDGLISVGTPAQNRAEFFTQIDTAPGDDYVYKTYPAPAEYTINPYRAYSYEMMLEDTERLQKMYPDLIRTSSIGQSVEGRDLLLIEFGRGDNRIFVNGTHHAREYITATYLMYAIDRYAYAYRTDSLWGQYSPKAILDHVTFCIVPMVNPDGVNLVQNGIGATQHAEELSRMKIYEGAKYGYSAWKANIRGVDLNRNYSLFWDPENNTNPRGSNGFQGDAPYTEPEVIAISDYVDQNPFDAYVAFHTQGQVFYWADDPINPTHLDSLIARDTGFKKIVEDGSSNNGTFFNYVYYKYQKPTLTVELCPYAGNYPYPDRDFDTVWNPAKNVLLLVANEIIYQKSLR